MTNPYYTHGSGVPASLSRGVSSNLRAEFDLIAAGFDGVYQISWSTALPSQTSNAGKVPTTDGASASWVAIHSKPWTAASLATQNAAIGVPYMMTYAGVCTLVLPVNPAANDIVGIKVANGRVDNILDLSGKTFEDDSIGTLILSSKYTCIYVQYINSSWRLV